MNSPSPVLPLLAERLAQGSFTIGQVAVTSLPENRIELRHRDDLSRPAAELETSADPLSARQIAHYDAAGEYRPLKGAPTLRGGWRLELADLEALQTAIDLFYPAALAIWMAQRGGRLRIVPLAETLERQTGMYRFARTISPAGAERLTQTQCGEGCSRRTLWRDPSAPVEEEQSGIPLLCPEACSFFVAAARLVAKAEFEAKAKAETTANP
jgi:hypothetical protein